MRQFAAQRTFFDPAAAFAFNADAHAVDLNHLLLLAIERAVAPPVVHRRMLFQPMNVVVVDPSLLSQMNPGDHEQVELPNLLPRALPPPDEPEFASSPFQQRVVRGEILSDAHGRLYEKLGQQIRPIHQLASGQFGEVIDLVPASSASPRMIAAPTGPKPVESSSTSNAQTESTEPASENGDSVKPSFVPLQKVQPQTSGVSHRKLFADPGQWRVVWWGEFKEILAPQLAHPERLKDTYRLPCYVQVLETERTVSIEELAAVYKSINERPARLYFLTDEIAAKLDLVLPLRPAPSPATRRDSNTLLAHERVFRLLAANDPTIDVVSVKNKLQTSSRQAETDAAKEQGSGSITPSVSLKENIPLRFVKELEFKTSREEALFDMHAKPTLGDRIRGFCRKLRVFTVQREITKWQALLAGKTADEQLWLVRPPRGVWTNSLVRDWAVKTLELGGYDASRMIIEWEIFWRRKGF